MDIAAPIKSTLMTPKPSKAIGKPRVTTKTPTLETLPRMPSAVDRMDVGNNSAG